MGLGDQTVAAVLDVCRQRHRLPRHVTPALQAELRRQGATGTTQTTQGLLVLTLHSHLRHTGYIIQHTA